jgi:hypothetical protein
MKDYIGAIRDLRGDAYLNPGWPGHGRNQSVITQIAIHHDAAIRPHDYDSVARYRQEANEHYNRLGPGLQYHFKIDNVGEIFWIRPFDVFLYHVGGQANYTTVAVCLDGYFHPPYNQPPTREQYEALKQLLDWLCTQNPQFPADQNDVYPHRYFSPTACCGETLVPFVNDYRNTGGNVGIPAEAVYDWPQYQPQPTPPPPAPVPEPPKPPQEPPKPSITYEEVIPAKYFAMVNTHLDNVLTGEKIADYPPGTQFDIVDRIKKDNETWLRTVYSKSKNVPNGIPEKDLRLVEPSPTPIPPDTTPSPAPPPPPVENPTDDQDNVPNAPKLTWLQKVLDFIKRLFEALIKKRKV